MKKLFLILPFIGLILFCNQVSAHGGRTDKNGGHINRKTMEYHCHSDKCTKQDNISNKKDYNSYKRASYKYDYLITRQEVLVEESLEEVIFNNEDCRVTDNKQYDPQNKKNCKVISGKWYDPYNNQYFFNPRDLQIDHLVPLKEAHRSGAYAWSDDKKMRYANDLENKEVLIAVYGKTNSSKGDKDPSDWMPPNENYHCEYIHSWQEIKKKWGLEMDAKEKEFITLKNKECEQKIASQISQTISPQ